MTTRSAVPQLDLARLWHMVRERWWIVALTTVIGLAAGMFVLARSKPLYLANALVRVQQTAPKLMDIAEVDTEDLKSLEALKTIERSLASRPIAEGLISRERITAEDLSLPPLTTPELQRAAIDLLAGSIHVGLERGTRLINITGESEKAETARKIPEVVIEEYRQQGQTLRKQSGRETADFLESEVRKLKDQLQKSEQDLQEYVANTPGGSSLESTQNLVLEQLRELTGKLTEAQANRLTLEAAVAQVKTLQGKQPQDLLAIPPIAADPAVGEQQRQISAQEALIANYRKRYLPKHPKWMQAQSQLQGLREGLLLAIGNAARNIDSKFEAARATEESYQAALGQQEERALELSQNAIPFNVRKREVESNRALYESVLKRLNETQVTRNFDQELIRIVEAPQLPEQPAKPRKKLILAASLVGGLAPGLGLCLLLGF